MTQKVLHLLETPILLLMIHWQPVFGVIASLAAIVYYISMLKVNVVDAKHNGSWKKYFTKTLKNIFK